MRLMIVAASVAVLGLAACNQQQDAPVMEETVAAEDVAVDTAAAEPAPEPAAETADPAMPDSAGPAPAAGPGPVTDDVRAGAQAEAESTNLRPRTD